MGQFISCWVEQCIVESLLCQRASASSGSGSSMVLLSQQCCGSRCMSSSSLMSALLNLQKPQPRPNSALIGMLLLLCWCCLGGRTGAADDAEA
jgi:hypothetical protein